MRSSYRVVPAYEEASPATGRLLTVRSLNSASAAGAKIGRQYPDIWVSEEILRRTTNTEILPQVDLFKSKEQRRAEELQGLLALLIVLGIVCAAALALTVFPNALVQLSPDLHSLPLVIGLALAIFVVLVVLVSGLHRRASFTARETKSATVRALLNAAFEGALEALIRRRLKEGMLLPRNVQRDVRAPDRMPTGVTPRGAEQLVAQWMRHLGEVGAEATQFQGDGGVDVAGERFIAQVKHFSGSVGVAPIREIAGVSITDGRGALFFTSKGYSTGAIEFANKAGVALFIYSAERAELFGINDRAKSLMSRGLGDPWA